MQEDHNARTQHGLIEPKRTWRSYNAEPALINPPEEPKSIFPPEVIFEILSWLPLKTLAQVQLVSKEWQAFITDHYFIEKHMDHMPIMYHWYNIIYTAAQHIRREQDLYSYVHGCDGILLLRNNTSSKYCLWNPALHRILPLPDPHNGNYGVAILYVPATKNYRIVAIYNDKESERIGCEVFTPGHSTAWQCLNFPDAPNSNGQCKKQIKVSVVPAGRAVHCILVIKAEEKTFEQVVSLDAGTERFTVTHLPKGVLTTWNLDWEGKLAFVEIVKNCLLVRELEDYKKQRLSVEKKVIPLPFLKDVNHDRNVFPLFAKQGEIWFWLKGEKIFIYNIENGRLTDVKELATFYFSSKMYPYKPTLVTFEGMVRDDGLDHLHRPQFQWD